MGRKAVRSYSNKEVTKTTTALSCPKCKHSWFYKGNGKWTQCPKCKFQFKMVKRKIKTEAKPKQMNYRFEEKNKVDEKRGVIIDL